MIALDETILSQYDQSPTIRTILECWNDAIDPRADLSRVLSTCLDLDTASGFGLDILGRIIGVTRVVALSEAQPYFGFAEGPTGQPFGQAPFYNGQPVGSAYKLTDAAYRQLLRAKALSNISAMTVPSVNRILMVLFAGRGDAYVVVNAPMDWTYKFNFVLTNLDRAILGSEALPRPSCTTLTFEDAS